ncbi:hypothetical protein EJ02DRAFT_421392 [Clathrospora elynae]|uniref:Uncharacterized protein n=1 Tax=Clathrospora elynae TaxID=706981 RepID=A0A6A5SU87_9PLEO|nr:hypothetical protein EJ02DRAFT_421392 [Clathrospora elynae]
MIKDMTGANLEMFTEILDVVLSLRVMTSGKDGKDTKFEFGRRVQWVVFQKPKIMKLSAAMEAYKSNLALMLSTLITAESLAAHIPHRPSQCLSTRRARANAA